MLRTALSFARLLLLAGLLPAPALAQGAGDAAIEAILDQLRQTLPPGAVVTTQDADGIPPGQMPGPGMCRVWYQDLAPGQQPAPLPCDQIATDLPAGARLVYGGPAVTAVSPPAAAMPTLQWTPPQL